MSTRPPSSARTSRSDGSRSSDLASSDQSEGAPAGSGHPADSAAFSRVLLKLSGEALMGDQGYGIDPEQISGVARVVRDAHDRDVEVAIVVGTPALLYGDGMITPAITVLSAVEGLKVATPLFDPYVVPIAVVILVGVFAIQRHGTHRVGGLFGPVMVVWFLTIAALGIAELLQQPLVLTAIDPRHAVAFFRDHGWHGFAVLGAVFLAVTGGEALYADMGHFGRRPIRLAWFSLVLPALVLNYLGQGALLLENPDAAHQPFFRLAPTWALLPLVILATVATIIASQATITGAFSLARQAIQLGLLPRLEIQHTTAAPAAKKIKGEARIGQ